MNKNHFLAIGTTFLVGSLIIFFAFFNKPEQTSQTTSDASISQKSPTDQNQQMNSTSFKELMKLERSQQCTFRTLAENNNAEGVIYIGDNQARGDFSQNFEGQSMNSHFILNEDKINIWLEGRAEGFTASLDSVDQTNNPEIKSQFNEKVDYECTAWKIDNEKFVLPDNVTFTDISAMMEVNNKNMQPGLGNTTEQCIACESVPAEAKEKCLAAFKCN